MSPNPEERKRMVDAAIDHLYKTDAPFVKTPKKDLFQEVQETAEAGVSRVRPLLKAVYEAARDNGDLWAPGGKGRLLATATELLIKEFGDRTKYSHEDLAWLVAVLHADLCVKQLM